MTLLHNHIVQHVLIFSLTLIIDIFWTRYNQATHAKRAGVAALWSAAIVLGGTFSTQIWLDNKWTVISSVLGALVGTYYAVKTGKTDE